MLQILNNCAGNYPHALEDQFPRVFGKILAYWNRPEIDAYFADLMVNSRKDRNGFPADVASDIVYLSMVHARQGAFQPADPLSVVPGRNGKAVNLPAGDFTVGALFSAAEAGDVVSLSRFVDAGLNVDMLDERQWTPLMIAASNGHAEMVGVLIAGGAHINHVDTAGYTPLHWAALNGHAAAVELLLSQRADVNAYSVHGWTALLQAVTRGRADVVKILLERGADVNAAADDGSTPLHKAAAGGRLLEVLLLLQKGAAAQVRNREGQLPIDLAAKARHQSIVVALTGSR
jgi:ankyrin repeat protein